MSGVDDGVECGVTTGQAVRIAWDRACAFSLLGRVPLFGAVVAPWLWPMHLAVVAGQGDRVRHRGGASMAVNDGGPRRVHPPAMIVAVVALAAQVGLILAVSIALAVALLPLLSPTLAGVLALLVTISPLVLEGPVSAVIRVSRDGESLTLSGRRRELAKDGPALVMTSLVRSKHGAAGEGRVLLAAMKSEWRDQQCVVIFYPANEALVAYYGREGAVLDDGAHRRMKFDFRLRRPAPKAANDAGAVNR